MKYGNPSGFFIEKFFEDVTWFNPNVTFSEKKGRFIYSVQIPAQRFNNSFELSVKNHYNDDIYANAYIFYSVLSPGFALFDMSQLGVMFKSLIQALSRYIEIFKEVPKEIKVKIPEKEVVIPEKEVVTPEEIKITEEEKAREGKPEEKKVVNLKDFLPLLALAAAVLESEKGGGGEGV